jgi:transcriptional regulator with XRE-family HTH domain
MANFEAQARRRTKSVRPVFINQLGSRIRRIRLHKRLTPTEFASTLNIQIKTLSEIENGIKEPPDKLLSTLINLFAIKRDWLITGKDEMFKGESKFEESINVDQFLKMYDQLSEKGKKRILNIVQVLLKTEYIKDT